MAALEGEDWERIFAYVACTRADARSVATLLLHAPFFLSPSIASNERLGVAFFASFSLRGLQTSRGESRIARQAAASKMAEFTIFCVKRILNLSERDWWL
ncbi:hypothetical protein ISCGN_020057 [Ixodes scapularis]